MKLSLKNIDQQWLIHEELKGTKKLRGKIKQLPRDYSFIISFNNKTASLRGIKGSNQLRYTLVSENIICKCKHKVDAYPTKTTWTINNNVTINELILKEKIKKVMLFDKNKLIATLERREEQKSFIIINHQNFAIQILIGLFLPFF